MFNLKKVKSLEKENVDLKSHNDLLIQRIGWYQVGETRLRERIELLESQLQVRDSKGRFTKKQK